MSDHSAPASTASCVSSLSEKPQNGLAGLKHWQYDLRAGLLVSLISLPFSLGIAVASGAPPVCGITSAIIAGFVLPFLGGSFVTISGPAAGLAPVLLASMILLGSGNMAKGYPLLLVCIAATGLVQVTLAWFKAARFAAIFPAAVVEGMLAAIGMLIIVKQLPLLMGHPFESHEFWGMIRETPAEFQFMSAHLMNTEVFILGLVSLAAIFLLAKIKNPAMKIVPPQVIVVALGTIAGSFLDLGSTSETTRNFLIQIPENPLSHGIVMPNIQGVISDSTLWWPVFTIVLTLTLIDGVESLATIAAVDKIDPFRRKSDPNKTLFAMGVSNICSSLIGGLTIIPGGVKSTANIMGGGRTQWANFYNACFLLIFLLAGRTVINMIPYSVLAAVLIYTGFKLCRPAVWFHVAHIGAEQLWLFAVTALVTVSTDLLWGIFAGLACKLLLNGYLAVTIVPLAVARNGGASPFSRLANLFRNPVTEREVRNGVLHVHVGRPLTCFNSPRLASELADVPAEVRQVKLHLTDKVTFVDHTSCDALLLHASESGQNGGPALEIVGLDGMRKRSAYISSMRLAAVEFAQVLDGA